MNAFAPFVYLGLQQQVLTPSAAESIAKSGTGLLLQTPILLVAIFGLIIALVKFRKYRLVSILTVFASLLLFLSSFLNPLFSVWVPFFLAPQPVTMPDGTIVPPSMEALQTNILYAQLIDSAVIALALLIYLVAIFTARAVVVKAKNGLVPSGIEIPKISIR